LTTERRALPTSLWDAGALLRPLSEQLVPLPAGAIRVATVHGFKGLEAACIVLTGLTRIDTAEARRLLYVGGSRAKGLLKIVLPKSSGPQVQACIADVLGALASARVEGSDRLL
jgi:superfamily I DNA/RNA helicase